MSGLNVGIIQNLIKNLTDSVFNAVAARICEERGFQKVTDSNGWNDGGRDLRVYNYKGAPQPVAIQISVAREWKPKLVADAQRAFSTLDCHTFIYVTNRRIDDVSFQKFQDELGVAPGISLRKMDRQDIAQNIVEYGLATWLFELSGISNVEPAESTTLRQRVSDAFMLLSDDTRSFRKRMIDHAIRVVTVESGEIARAELAQAVIDTLGLPSTARATITGGIDRQLQQKKIVQRGGKIHPSPNVKQVHAEAMALAANERASFRNTIVQTLSPFLAKSADIDTAADRVVSQFSQILAAYRNYQVGLLSTQPVDAGIQTEYLKSIRRIDTLLCEIGVSAKKSRECYEALLSIDAEKHPVSKLSAGEVFRRLLTVEQSAILNVFETTAGIEFHVDSNVLLPFLCGRLYQPKANRSAFAAADILAAASALSSTVSTFDVYLQECAGHLISAARYSPIVHKRNLSELVHSSNHFVSFFASLGDAVVWGDFLKTFGYRGSHMEFDRHISVIMNRLKELVRGYGIKVSETGKGVSQAEKTRASQDIEQAVDESGDSRPWVLKEHDAAVIALVRVWNSRPEAQIVVSWDRMIQRVCRADEFTWWCLDPCSLCDLLSLTMTDHSTVASVADELTASLSKADQKRAARVWDTLVGVEQDGMFEADLFIKSEKFTDQFLRQQESRDDHIAEEWEEFKEMKEKPAPE